MRSVFFAAILGAALVGAGCAVTQRPAPVDDRRAAPAAQPRVLQPAPAAGPRTYIVKRGDTLYSVALEQGVDYRELAQLNRIDDPSRIRLGQELRLPPTGEERPPVQVGATRRPGEIESRPLGSSASPPQAAAEGATKTSPKALRLPYSEQNLASLSRGETRGETKPESRPEAAKPAAPAGERDPDAIDFAWPVRGRVLQAFSEPNNKGLDIAGKPGDPVLAAAAGRVMYTGTGIRGYGKLIVIKHDNNFNSVYAHNREILVKEGQNVTRGQRIAELGDTDSDTPKLHFEIRKSGKPVDPAKYLPPS